MGIRAEVKTAEVKIEEIETTVKELVNGKKVEAKFIAKFDQAQLSALVQKHPDFLKFAVAGWKIALYQKQVRAFLIAGFVTADEILPLLEKKLIPGITSCFIKE